MILIKLYSSGKFFFADDTNLVHFSKSVNKLKKYININMKISLRGLILSKCELVMFKQKNMRLDCPIKTKHSRKRLYPSKSVKYLDVKTDEKLNWLDQPHDISTKINKANVLLHKIRNYAGFNTLKAISFAIFDSHKNYINII